MQRAKKIAHRELLKLQTVYIIILLLNFILNRYNQNAYHDKYSTRHTHTFELNDVSIS